MGLAIITIRGCGVMWAAARSRGARPDLGISVIGLFLRIIDDFYMSRPSVLLLLVFWPFAFFMMIMAQIQRVVQVGSIRSNVSHVVSNDPRVMNPILKLSAVEIAKRIRYKSDHPDKLTSVQVVELFINQIRLTNLYLLAIVAPRFELARKEAEAADFAVQNDSVPENAELWGVPIVVKECFELPGMPYTGGIIGRLGKVGENTSSPIKQAQDAGAIILGSTNISEACMWHESINMVNSFLSLRVIILFYFLGIWRYK